MSLLPPSSTDSTPRTSCTSTEVGLPQIEDLSQHYRILRDLGSGTFARCVLVQCRTTGERVALKLVRKTSTRLRDFLREYNSTHFLSAHPSIVTTYRVALETSLFYAFALEVAPLGDLFSAIPVNRGLSPVRVRSVVRQIAGALEFMHSKQLVHRDVKPENVLIFDKDCLIAKLCDFGRTREANSTLRKTPGPSSRHLETPYAPPEIAQAAWQEIYAVDPSHDVWSLGVLIISALTGTFPWEAARLSDPTYQEFVSFQKHRMERRPACLRGFSHRLVRLLRRMLEPKVRHRCGIREVSKYLNDPWLVKEPLRSVKQQLVEPTTVTERRCSSLDISSSTTAHVQTLDSALTEVVSEEHRLSMDQYSVDTKCPRSERLSRVRNWLQHGEDCGPVSTQLTGLQLPVPTIVLSRSSSGIF